MKRYRVRFLHSKLLSGRDPSGREGLFDGLLARIRLGAAGTSPLAAAVKNKQPHRPKYVGRELRAPRAAAQQERGVKT